MRASGATNARQARPSNARIRTRLYGKNTRYCPTNYGTRHIKRNITQCHPLQSNTGAPEKVSNTQQQHTSARTSSRNTAYFRITDTLLGFSFNSSSNARDAPCRSCSNDAPTASSLCKLGVLADSSSQNIICSRRARSMQSSACKEYFSNFMGEVTDIAPSPAAVSSTRISALRCVVKKRTSKDGDLAYKN